MIGTRLVAALCLAEVIGMTGVSTFPALIPVFAGEWELSNTAAGWISAIYFAGYVAGVPFLVSLTDRADPRRIWLFSLALGALASAGFAIAAEGFWTALLFRFLQGVGLAGTYMPGLKALSDHIDGPRQSRAVAFYTASFGIGTALSYFMAGEVADRVGWESAFGVNAGASVLAFAIVWRVLASRPPAEGGGLGGHLLDFRPVLANRPAMAYILGYAGHNWELFAFRAWVVAFLVHAQSLAPQTLSPGGDTRLSATVIATVVTLAGVFASIAGNELAVRVGRRRLLVLVAMASVAVGLVTGFSATISFWLAAGLCLCYGFLLAGDSAALTAGCVAAAAPGQRGATLAVHAFLGFLGGTVGPIVVGVVLDLSGGAASFGWGVAFAAMAVGSAVALGAVAWGGGTVYSPPDRNGEKP